LALVSLFYCNHDSLSSKELTAFDYEDRIFRWSVALPLGSLGYLQSQRSRSSQKKVETHNKEQSIAQSKWSRTQHCFQIVVDKTT
jgi:hypothetical protein